MSDEATTTLPKTGDDTPMAPNDHIGTGTPPVDPPPVPDPNKK